MTPKLAILIPTIVGREHFYEKLRAKLDELIVIGGHQNHVEIIPEKDNCDITIGEKRNILTDKAIKSGATHRSFIDDDDMVFDNYFTLNMPGVIQNFDCNSLVGVYTENGITNPNKHIFYHSLRYTHWYEDDKYYYRNPNHLNVIALDKIKDIRFEHKNFGEDGCWSEELARLNVLKTEHIIDEPFYHYLFRTKTPGNI